MKAYLFVHFRETTLPEGEQVHFALSKDGFHWEKVNDGKPILWSEKGENGVRDFTITRTKDGMFYILATDLSLANNFDGKYEGSWGNVSTYGSNSLVLWKSKDLVHWDEQRMIELGDENFGCLWAPDIIFDKEREEYIIHWSSSHRSNDFTNKAIFCTRTKDFESFTKPELFYKKEDSGIIDSCMCECEGTYYRFTKSEFNPHGIILEKGESIFGEYTRLPAFDEEMKKLERPETYEAPTVFQLEDGRWCLMIDFFGCKKEEQGYVPFVAEDIKTGRFVRSDAAFSFPYGFKHGTVLEITLDEYERIKNFEF